MAENYPLRRSVLTAECPPTVIATTNVNCETLQFTGPGTYYFFASPDATTGVPCGERYWLSFEGPGLPPCGNPVAPTTWGRIKNAYR